jgi:uncharacterized protein (TIGR00725 family)
MAIRTPVIGVMGRGEGASARDEALAEQLGELIARSGWHVLTGGRTAGVMGAASRGAKRVPGSTVIGVLPGTSGGESPYVDIAIFTAMGDGRNLINVLSSDVVVVCGTPGAGTASEAALAIKNRKPVILLALPSEAQAFFAALRPSISTTGEPSDAIELIRAHLGA